MQGDFLLILEAMAEREFYIESVDPLVFFGNNDQNIEVLRDAFPKLKIIARGEMIKVIGDAEEISEFESIFTKLLEHTNRKGVLLPEELTSLLSGSDAEAYAGRPGTEDVLVFGRNGMQIKARSANQQRMVDSCLQNDLTIAIGPAGTGKTYTAVALAVRALKNKEVKRIILTRPAVEAGENLGFLPGDLKEKLDPYMQPLYDALWDMIPSQRLEQYISDRIIEIAPLAFMRGRTLDHAFVILDEAQNATPGQLKMFLTRMGKDARFIVTGDVTQVDLPKHQQSGLIHAVEILKDIPGIEIIFLDNSDIVRHKLVSRILNAYNNGAK